MTTLTVLPLRGGATVFESRQACNSLVTNRLCQTWYSAWLFRLSQKRRRSFHLVHWTTCAELQAPTPSKGPMSSQVVRKPKWCPQKGLLEKHVGVYQERESQPSVVSIPDVPALTTVWLQPDESESEGHAVMSNSLWPQGLFSSWNSPGQKTGVGSLSLLQGIIPTQGSYPGLLHCRQILYQLSPQGSPRILEWVAYPFPSGSSPPRNRTGVSCIASRFFTNWAIRKAKWKTPPQQTYSAEPFLNLWPTQTCERQ